MPRPVFISYARTSTRTQAERLYQALGPESAYLDSEELARGEPFSAALVDALFDAKVIVVLAEPVYFTRWYCLLEFRVARTPFLRLAERPGSTRAEKEAALRGIVVALPGVARDLVLERLPPPLRVTNWPMADDADATAAVVRERLAANLPTFGERLDALGQAESMRELLREAMELPPPQRTGSIPLVPPISLPASLQDRFVGRADDLWRIHDLLAMGGGDPAAASLTGSIEAGGGVGKTRLALEYLYRFGTRHFRGGLFWINAEHDVESQHYAVVKALDPAAPAVEVLHGAPGGVAGALARTVRSRGERAPMLFVIDNVPEPELGTPPLPLSHWCPVVGEAAVLATSRTRVALGEPGSVVPITIDTLSPEAAVRLLTIDVRRDALPWASWMEIAEGVGHLPLALELLNGLLASDAMSAGELLETSREERPGTMLDSAMEVLRPSVPVGVLRGVTEAFAASYERLTDAERYAARLIAWISPAPVPELVLELVDGDPFTPSVRATLRGRHFVTAPAGADAAGEAALFGSMHRVLADFLQSRSENPHHELLAVLCAISEVDDGTWGDENLSAARLVAPALAAAALHSNGFASSSLEPHQLAEVLSLVHQLSGWLNDVGAYPWAEVCLRSCVEGRERALGAEHPETLHAMRDYADVVRARGDAVRARTINERVVESSCRMLGPAHPETLASINNLALTMWEQGERAEAERLQERVFAESLRVSGEEHHTTLTAMLNLTISLQARGELGRAQEMQERGLEVSRRTVGDDHPVTLRAMLSLATTRYDGGDLASAQEMLEQVLTRGHHVLGEEHPITIQAMETLAETLRLRGEFETAQAMHARVLAVERRSLGDKHPGTLVAMANFATTQFDRGELADAHELREQLVAASQRVLGEEHPTTLLFMAHLAATLGARGDLGGAQELCERVLDAQRRLLGEEHPKTLITMHVLVQLLLARGDYAGAQELAQRTLAIDHDLRGEEHWRTLSAMNDLGEVLRARGELEEAQSLFEQVITMARRTLGEEHTDTLSAMNNLGLVFQQRGDFVPAQEVQERVLASRRRTLGEEHPDTLITMNNLAETLRARGDLAAALDMHERVLAGVRRIHGDEHPQTLVSMNNVALVHHARGELARAQGIHERVLAVKRRILGPEHPSTLISLKNLAETLRARGDPVAAQEILGYLVHTSGKRAMSGVDQRGPRPPALGTWLLMVVCALVISANVRGVPSAAVMSWVVWIAGIYALGSISRWLGRSAQVAVRDFLIGVREGIEESRAKRSAAQPPGKRTS